MPFGKQFLASFFDGLCGSVIGVIAIIAVQILKASVEGSLEKVKDRPIGEVNKTAQVGPAAVLYMLALVVLYKFTNKYTSLMLVIIGAVAGQFLFVDQSTSSPRRTVQGKISWAPRHQYPTSDPSVIRPQ